MRWKRWITEWEQVSGAVRFGSAAAWLGFCLVLWLMLIPQSKQSSAISKAYRWDIILKMCAAVSAFSVLRRDKGNSSRLWLRSGDVYTGNGVVEFMRQLLAHLPNRTRILFRGDSGFFAEKWLDYLDDRGQDYLIKAKFKGLRLLLETKQWTRIKANHDWESTEFTHQCGTWSRSRKFVAVRREKEIDGKDADTLFEIGVRLFLLCVVWRTCSLASSQALWPKSDIRNMDWRSKKPICAGSY